MVAGTFLRARPRPAALAGLALLLAAGAGCSCSCGAKEASEEPSADAAEATDSPAAASGRSGRAPVPAAPLAGEEAFASESAGGIHGTVLFTGKVPERFELGAATSAECQHHQGVDQRSNVVLVADGKLANAFVYVKSGFDKAHIPPAPAAAVTLDQQGCMYVPRVVALQLGQTLLVHNSDPITHNVHALPKRNDGLNRTMGANQAPLEFHYEKRELGIPFKCDIHAWMGALVFVEEHPWFAVSDAQGRFRIAELPPGNYVLEAKHETLGSVQGSVTVSAGRSTGVTLTLAQ